MICECPNEPVNALGLGLDSVRWDNRAPFSGQGNGAPFSGQGNECRGENSSCGPSDFYQSGPQLSLTEFQEVIHQGTEKPKNLGQ